MTAIIDGTQFCRMMIHGAASINAEKQRVNDLNVFPVPDGDTGTNMALTMGAAVPELKKKAPTTVDEAASLCASALLRGARGNSGVILSLLFRGFSRAVKDKTTIDGRDFAIALDYGVAAAYKAVMKPAEGTILTVSRMSAAKAAETARTDNSLEAVLEASLQEAQSALSDTINQNPVLKRAGVIDAGGKGFVIILQGMLDELRGVPVPESGDAASGEGADRADFGGIPSEEITFAFDTVFIVRKENPGANLDLFRAYLSSIGDSLVIGEDDEAFKVHVHTNTPGDALNEAQKYGTLELAKIENMVTQARDLAAGRKAQSTDDLDALEAELEAAEHAAPAEKKPYGFVAVCAGDGLAELFRDLGVDGIVGGGQTMNPCTEDILREVNRTPAEVVYILPNNKNIVMAAEQCIPLAEGKQVIVLPTHTVPQGISAMLSWDRDADVETNTEAMTSALATVHTSEVTYAARDSDFDGFAIREGDFLVLTEGQLFGTGSDLTELLKCLAMDTPQQEAEFINIYYGEDVTEEEAKKTEEIFVAACPNAEVSLMAGGQPVYYYMIASE